MARLSKTDNQVKKSVNFEDAISMTGFGLFNLFVIIGTGGCLMSVIIETMGMMIIIPAAQCDLNLSLYEKGILSSISFFGVVSSSHLWGYFADTRGRRGVLIVSLVVSSLISFVCSIVPWSWLFILLRFFNGFFIGGASAIVYAFAGEFHDNRYRPKIVSWIATFVAFGNMAIPGLAWLILPQTWSFHIPFLSILFRPWRLLLIIYALPSLLVAICLYFLPESPKYLLTQKKHDEVLKILQNIYCINTRKSADDYLVSQITWDELGIATPGEYSVLKSIKMQTLPLFQGTLLRKTLMVSSLHFGIYLANAGVNMWYPEILNNMSHYVTETLNDDVTLCEAFFYDENDNTSSPMSFNATKEVKLCKDVVKTNVFELSIYIGLAYMVVYIFIGSVINIFGKKNLIVGFLTITGIAGLCAQYITGYTAIQVLTGLFLMGGCGIGIVNAIVVDLYPTQIRAMAMAVSLMFGRLGAVAGSNVVGPLIYNFCDYFFYIFAADHIIMIIIVMLLPSSTKLPKLDIS